MIKLVLRYVDDAWTLDCYYTEIHIPDEFVEAPICDPAAFQCYMYIRKTDCEVDWHWKKELAQHMRRAMLTDMLRRREALRRLRVAARDGGTK